MSGLKRLGAWLCMCAAMGLAGPARAIDPSAPEWSRPKTAAELAERFQQALERQDTLLVGPLIHPASDGDPDREVLLGVIRADYGCPIEKVEVAPLTPAGFEARAGAARSRKPSLPPGAVLTVTFKMERNRTIKVGNRLINMGHAASWLGFQ